MNNDLDIFDTVISTKIAYHDVHEGILTEFHPRIDSNIAVNVPHHGHSDSTKVKES